MKTFIGKMTITSTEEWSVEAETEGEARAMLECKSPGVEMDDSGGEITDWAVDSIRVAA